MEMLYHSVNDLIRLANEYQIPLWKVVLLADVQERQVTVEESFETMRQMYQAMRQADQGYDGSIVSASGMAGGDGEKLHAYNASGRSLAGGYMGLVMEKAVKMGESNACMKRIVAAPTAGACGVIPAVFLSYEEYCKETENRMVEALFVRCIGWMSGGDWFGECDGSRGAGISAGGRRGVYRECSGICPQKYVGIDL